MTWRLSSEEMKSVMQVQIKDAVVCISPSANTFVKGVWIYFFSHLFTMGK